jgi:hypothetical protein
MSDKQTVASLKTENEPVLVTLSELQCQSCISKLPDLCQEVQALPGGKEICRAAAKCVGTIIEQCLEFPLIFIFCCKQVLKVLVIALSKDVVYCAISRSPLPDEGHLEDFARFLGKTFTYIENLWYPVPPFGTEFVKAVILKLEKKMRVIISDDAKQHMERIAQAYEKFGDQFGFDVIVYNVLHRTKFGNGDNNGILKIDVASKNEGGVVVRVIAKYIGSNPPEFKLPLPIVGLVFESNDFPSLKDCLQSPMVELFGRALLQEWSKQKPRHSFERSGNSTWQANVKLYLDKSPKTKLIKDTERITDFGLNMGGNTSRAFLLQELKTRGPRRFKDRLLYFSKPRVLPTAKGKRKILWLQVLEDFSYVLNSMDTQDALNVLETRHQVIDKLLALPDRYLQLTPAPTAPTDQERWNLLREDLLTNSSNYGYIMNEKLIPFGLRGYRYERGQRFDLPKFVLEYLKSYPEATANALVDIFGLERIKRADESAIEAWQVFFRSCEEQGYTTLIDHTEEILYSNTMSNRQKFLRDFYAVFLGMFFMGITVGIVPWYRIANNVKRRAYQKYLRRFLGDRIR